jgi:hypothetical protein
VRAVSCLNLEEYELSSSPSIATFVLFLEGSRSELLKPFGSSFLGELDGLPSSQNLLVRVGIAINENSVVGLGELSLQLLKVNSTFRKVIGQIGHVKSRLQILSLGLESGPSGSLLFGGRRNRRRVVGGNL